MTHVLLQYLLICMQWEHFLRDSSIVMVIRILRQFSGSVTDHNILLLSNIIGIEFLDFFKSCP